MRAHELLESYSAWPYYKGGDLAAPYEIETLVHAPEVITGSFVSKYGQYTTLEGGPKEVTGDYKITNNSELRSLKGCPEIIHGDFIIDHCAKLESLEGGPRIVEGDYVCSTTGIRSIQGAPDQVNGDFGIWSAAKLESLSGWVIKDFAENFTVGQTGIKTLEGGPETVGKNFNCSSSRLVTLRGAPRKIGGDFECFNVNIVDEYEFRYALMCDIGGIFGNTDGEVEPIISKYHWGHGDKKLVMQGMKKLKELKNARD